MRSRNHRPPLASLALALALALAGPALAQRSDKASQAYEDAAARFERNDVPGAIIQLKNALQQDARMLAAQVLLGKALLAAGQSADAEAAFAKALELGVTRTEIAVPLAQALHYQGKYEQLLERAPAEGLPRAQKLEMLVLRGHAHKGLWDFRSAARAFEEARAIDPKYTPALLSQADLLAELGQRADAVKLVDAALKLAPSDPEVWQVKGSFAQAAGDGKRALAAYGKALELRPGYVDARIGRVALLLDLGRLDEAAPDVEWLRKESPQDPRGVYARAVYLAKRGDAAGAREALIEVTRLIDPVPREILRRRSPLLLLIAGLAHHGLDQLEKARSYLEDFLRVDEHHVGARRLLGSILLSQGNDRAAISMLEPVARRSPNDWQALSLLASAHMARRQYASATQYLERALKASGDAPEVRATLGVSLLGAGQSEAALDQLQRAFKKNPGELRSGIALAGLYLKRGRPQQALEVAAALVERNPESAVALNTLGAARAATGDAKGARTAYGQALRADKSFLPAQLNLARLDLAEGNHVVARGRLGVALKERPYHLQAMIELAAVERAAGRNDEAIRWLERARASNRRNPEAAVRLVDLYLLEKAPEKALAVAKEADAAQLNHPAILAALTRAHLALGDPKSAQTVLSRMSRLAAFDPARQTEIAEYQLAADNPEGAAFSLDKALSSKPDYLPALALQTELDLRKGDVAQAEARAKAIVARNADQAIGYRLLADAALAKKNFPRAIENYRIALAKEETTDGALRLIQAHVLAGSTDAAVRFLESWVRRYPKDLVAMRALADGYLRVGDLPAAKLWYERVLARRVDDPYVLNNLATVLSRQGDASALAHAERAHKLAPQDAAIQDTLGWMLVQRGQRDAGLRHLREARLRDPKSPEIRYHLAVALAQAGRSKEARAELEPALQAGATFEEAGEARKLLQTLSAR
ncbi:MAG: XrtA/PEP-CTERM system TPR-repeat protein PrsT [Burkholderiales bacterium]